MSLNHTISEWHELNISQSKCKFEFLFKKLNGKTGKFGQFLNIYISISVAIPLMSTLSLLI